MRDLGVKGVHIAERDTQARPLPRPRGVFVNTWSVEGFIAEGFQPAELGWGTHETWFPENAFRHETGCRAGIWIERPGAITRVHTWCPTPGPQFGFLVTHNEAISIADYYTVGDAADPEYRPTCHYAYHPCDDAMLSLHETFGSGRVQERQHILTEYEITGGIDELGVLLYGHERNALWYGSRLSIDETRDLAPYQNATCLQVASAVVAGMVWALENPRAGIVETDEMDHARCLADPAPLPRPGRGALHRLDPPDRPLERVPVHRGHRRDRPLAVQERAGELNDVRSDRDARSGGRARPWVGAGATASVLASWSRLPRHRSCRLRVRRRPPAGRVGRGPAWSAGPGRRGRALHRTVQWLNLVGHCAGAEVRRFARSRRTAPTGPR